MDLKEAKVDMVRLMVDHKEVTLMGLKAEVMVAVIKDKVETSMDPKVDMVDHKVETSTDLKEDMVVIKLETLMDPKEAKQDMVGLMVIREETLTDKVVVMEVTKEDKVAMEHQDFKLVDPKVEIMEAIKEVMEDNKAVTLEVILEDKVVTSMEHKVVMAVDFKLEDRE